MPTLNDKPKPELPKELLTLSSPVSLEELQKKVYVLWYRTKFRPQSSNILAEDLKDAYNKGQEYCKRFNLRFISVVPFFCDLNAHPEIQRREPEESVVPSITKPPKEGE